VDRAGMERALLVLKEVVSRTQRRAHERRNTNGWAWSLGHWRG